MLLVVNKWSGKLLRQLVEKNQADEKVRKPYQGKKVRVPQPLAQIAAGQKATHCEAERAEIAGAIRGDRPVFCYERQKGANQGNETPDPEGAF